MEEDGVGGPLPYAGVTGLFLIFQNAVHYENFERQNLPPDSFDEGERVRDIAYLRLPRNLTVLNQFTWLLLPIRNESAPIQLAQCWFAGLAIFSLLKYKYIFQIKYTEAILSNSTLETVMV